MVSVAVAGLAVVDLVLAGLLVSAGLALTRERQPDDPDYRPRHARQEVSRDEIQRALNDSRRDLRRLPAPWAQPEKRHSDETPMEGS